MPSNEEGFNNDVVDQDLIEKSTFIFGSDIKK